MRDVGIPTTTVAAVVIGILGLGVLALALPVVRRRLAASRTMTLARAGVAILAAVVVALVVFATPWWLVLLIPVIPLVIAVRPSGQLTRAVNQQAAAALRGNDAPVPHPHPGRSVPRPPPCRSCS